MSKNNFNGFRLPWQRLFQIVLGNSRRLLELVKVTSSDVSILFMEQKDFFEKLLSNPIYSQNFSSLALTVQKLMNMLLFWY